MEQPQKRKVVAKVSASNVYSPASSSHPVSIVGGVGGPSSASALSPPNGVQLRVRVNSNVSPHPRTRPLSAIVGGEPTQRRGSALAARASTSRDGTPIINGYSSASEAPRIMLRPAVSSTNAKSQAIPTTVNISAPNLSITTTRPTVRSQPTLPPKARVAVASAGTKPPAAASMPSSPHIQPTSTCIQTPHSTPEVFSAPTSPTTYSRHLPPTPEVSSPPRPNASSTSNSWRIKSKVPAQPSPFPHTRTASVGSMTGMHALLSPPQQPLSLSTPSNSLSPATAPTTPIFRPKARITHIIHGPSNDESTISPPTSTLSSRSSTRSTNTVASSTVSTQLPAGTPRGRPPSTMGLGMALGPRRSGSKGEDLSDCEYEGRLGILQESTREGLVYQDDKGAARGVHLKPPNHTDTGESTSTSEVEKDDGENDDEDDEEGDKSKYTKGVIIDGMGEVQIVDIDLIREEEEAKASRKVLDLEISNKSLSTLNAILEATKARQAREIRELKRKMREMRHLPPSFSLANGPPVPPPLHSPRSTTSSPHRESPSSSDSEDSEDEGDKPDPTFDHIKSMLETLLAEGIRAIERTREECVPDDEVKEDGERRNKGSGGAKVLGPAELLEYRRARGEVVEEHEHEATEVETIAEGSGAEDEHP